MSDEISAPPPSQGRSVALAESADLYAFQLRKSSVLKDSC